MPLRLRRRDDLEGAQAVGGLVEVRGDDQLVGAGLVDEGFEALRDRLRAADDRRRRDASAT